MTFLFTDIEGSTKLLHELGSSSYAEALREHRRVLREAFLRHGGVEVDTQGDAFFVAFPTARSARGGRRSADGTDVGSCACASRHPHGHGSRDRGGIRWR